MTKLNRALSAMMTFAIALSCMVFPTFAAKDEIDSCEFITEKSSDTVEISPTYPKIGEPIKAFINDKEDEKFLYSWFINGIKINNYTDTYTPIEDDMEKMLTVKIYDLNADLVGIKNIFISKIPVIYIETENRKEIVDKETKLNAAMNIQGNDEYNTSDLLYNGKIEIKGRGNTTWNQEKKPYKIKLDSKANLFGMGKNKHWVLLSNPFDTSNLRNDIAYKLSGKMGLGFQDGTWVELILNGEDAGLYYIAEHIRVDSTRTDITDWEAIAEDVAKTIYKKNKDIILDKDELADAMIEDMSWTTSDKFTFNGIEFTVSEYYNIPDITGGYLLEQTVPTGDGVYFSTPKNVSIEINTPETVSDNMQEYIVSYINAFEDALMSDDFCTYYNGKKMRYTEFIDLDSFAKGVLINEIFQNSDFCYKSTYFYKDVDGRLCYGPVWDMDWCLNTNAYSWTSGGREWISRLLQDPVFMKKLRDVYWEYRYTAIQDILKEGGEIDTASNMICEAAIHNDEIWNNEIGFEENVADYKFRIQDKLIWLDSTLATLESSHSFSKTAVSNDVKLKYNNNILSITVENIEPTSYIIFVNGEYEKTITDISSIDSISLNASDEDIISVAAYTDATPAGGNYVYNQNCITAIDIDENSIKTVYSAGEHIDLSGLNLTATYKDGTKKSVKPDIVYTKVSDSLDTQLFCYDKITNKCGSVVLVLACNTQQITIPLVVNPKENYILVEHYINKIPTDSEDNNFLKYTAEAWEQYEALSISAKAEVSNYQILNDAIEVISSKANESMVVGCYGSIAMRNDAKNNIIIAAKAGANSMIFSLGDESTQMTFKRNTSQNKVIGIKRLGDIEFWTVRRGLSLNTPLLTVSAKYKNDKTIYNITKNLEQLIHPQKDIYDVTYPACIFVNEEFNIYFNHSDVISKIRLSEKNVTLFETDNFDNSIAYKFSSTGNHSVSLYYMCDSKWFEYGTLNLYVREAVETGKVYYNDFNNNNNFKIITDTDVSSVKLISNMDAIDITGTEKGEYKVWRGTKLNDVSSFLFIGEAINFSIQPVKTDYYINDIISGDDFFAYISDAYNNTVKTKNFTIESVDTSSVGVKTVTASYGNMTASCTINVERPDISAVTIKNYPNKQNFYLLEKLDISGLVLKITYSNGSTKYIVADDEASSITAELDSEVSLKDQKTFKRLGKHDVTVKYKGFEVSYQVNVSFNLIFIIKAVFAFFIQSALQ